MINFEANTDLQKVILLEQSARFARLTHILGVVAAILAAAAIYFGGFALRNMPLAAVYAIALVAVSQIQYSLFGRSAEAQDRARLFVQRLHDVQRYVADA